MSLHLGLRELGISNEGMIDGLKEALKGRKKYYGLFNFMKMQKYTKLAYEEQHRGFVNKRPVDETVGPSDTYIFKMVGLMKDHDLSAEDALWRLILYRFSIGKDELPTVPVEVKRSTVVLSDAGIKQRISMVKTRIDELKKFPSIFDKYLTLINGDCKTAIDMYDVDDCEWALKKVIACIPALKQKCNKFSQFFIKEYQIELKNLLDQKG